MAPSRWMRGLATRLRRAHGRVPLDLEAVEAVLLRDATLRRLQERKRLRIRRWLVPVARQRRSRARLPRLRTQADVADLLDLPVDRLEWYADPRGLNRGAPPPLHHYVRTLVPKRAGGVRLLESPKGRLRAAQRRLLADVLAPQPLHAATLGFAPGRSVLDHAFLHAGSACVLRFDLQDFFWQVGARRAVGLFRSFGLSDAVARILGGLVVVSTPARVFRGHPALRPLRFPHLPQGAPTSPAVANLCAQRLDRRLTGLAARFDATYSRYADDLVFSGGPRLKTRTLTAWVEAIVDAEGWRLNPDKTRVMPASQRQLVGGLVVNERPCVPRRERERLEATLHAAATRGAVRVPATHAPRLAAHLRGKVAWVAQVHPRQGVALERLYASIDWSRVAVEGV